MAILPQIQEHDASEHVHETYDQVKSRYGGFLPDIYKAFANDPEYLASINDHMARVLKPRKVDAKTKGVIALKTIALWSEVTRFSIAAGVRWPQPVEATLSAEEAA